jgi:hypothetical protein
MREKTRRDARVAEGAPLLREYRVKSLIEGSNPSLSARYAKRPARGVLRIWRREVVDEPTVRRICQEQIRTAAGWPWSAQRGRVRPMDGPNNPARTQMLAHSIAGAFCVSGGERWWTSPTVRRICQEQIRTAAGWPWSAQRGRVRPMDGPNNPQATRYREVFKQRPEFTACRNKSG